MAIVWAVNNGNWSNAATWSGSYIPQPGDDVFANNRTVNVDTSFQVLSLRNTSGTGITAGGSFNFNSGSISASLTSATGIVHAQGTLITVTAGSGTVTISAPLTTADTATATSNIQVINYSGNCDLTLTVTALRGGQNLTNGSGINGLLKTSPGLLIVNGNVVSGVANPGSGAGNNNGISSNSGNIIINGNVNGATFGGGAQAAAGVVQSAGSLTINGNVTGGGSNVGLVYGVIFSGTSLNISGSITSGITGPAVVCTSAAIINITGSILAQNAVTPVNLSGASTLVYSGSLIATNNAPAIISSNASATNIFTGPFINTNNTMAVQCIDMVLTQDASTFWNFGDITLYSPEQLAYYPSASDIRQGTTYADGTVSGSLAMPPPTAVIAGTPTDNTTGSAVLTPTQLQDAVWGRDLAQMTETGSIGYRLAKSATTDSTGNQIASYLI